MKEGMSEELLKEYLFCTGTNTFQKFKIEIICSAGGTLIFRECELHDFGSFEQHTADLFDVVVWIYSNMRDRTRALY